MDTYLGIDCGSTSIKLVLIDSQNNIVEGVYLKNRGIIDTLKEAFEGINITKYKILGCGVTGSGRNFAKAVVKADVVKSEVIAHSVATLTYYPDTKTIFEIGGEDCKLMTVDHGVIHDFKMNNICGGGTGSMIETIATRLGLKVEEVGDFALKSKVQVDLPGKCGIFCQSAVVAKLNTGMPKEDILMGVCRALIRNYLTICKGAELSPPYIFQGATAQNKALVKSLEEEVGDTVLVPEQCSLMGAIGIAILTREEDITESNFRPIQREDQLDIKTFKCSGCPNKCEVTQIFENGEFLGSSGSRCGKWNKREHKSHEHKKLVSV